MEKNYKEILENFLHELTTISSSIKAHAETISMLAAKRQDWNGLKIHSEQLLENTFLFNTHLDTVNFQLNPGFFTAQRPGKRDIYGKFKKSCISFQRAAKQKGVTLKLDGDEKQMIDTYFVIDTLPNLLLDNAIKYATCSSEVNIEVWDDGDEVTVSVSNEGPYIEPHEVDKLFERGYRSDEAIKTGVQGSGFGMSFIKHICDIHGAELKIICDPNYTCISGIRYSTFTVEIVFKRNMPLSFSRNLPYGMISEN